MTTNSTNPEEVSPEEANRRAIVELARKDYKVRDGELEVDDNAVVGHSEDNGAYVEAWIWVDFAGTPFDKELEDANGVTSGD